MRDWIEFSKDDDIRILKHVVTMVIKQGIIDDYENAKEIVWPCFSRTSTKDISDEDMAEIIENLWLWNG